MVAGTPNWANGGASPQLRARPRARLRGLPGRRRQALHARPALDDLGRAEPRAGNGAAAARLADGPRRYAQLLDRAYGALKKRVRRSIKVIGGMTCTTGDVMPDGLAEVDAPAQRQAAAAGLVRAQPVHRPRPATSSKRPYYRGLRDMSATSTRSSGEVRSALALAASEAEAVAVGVRRGSDRANHAFRFFVSRATQARWLAAAWRIAHRTLLDRRHRLVHLQDAPDPDGITCGLLDERRQTEAGVRRLPPRAR